jgi:hypothetical protein
MPCFLGIWFVSSHVALSSEFSLKQRNVVDLKCPIFWRFVLSHLMYHFFPWTFLKTKIYQTISDFVSRASYCSLWLIKIITLGQLFLSNSDMCNKRSKRKYLWNTSQEIRSETGNFSQTENTVITEILKSLDAEVMETLEQNFFKLGFSKVWMVITHVVLTLK